MIPAEAAPLPDLHRDRDVIEEHLVALLHTAESDPASDAARYAVFSGGQRLRPVLALRIARWLGTPVREVATAAAAVEILHCASLVIDDLPCMDNAATRRDRPSTHIVFGEANAILAAFALVSLAARAVEKHTRFQRKLLGVLDCKSLIRGQCLELTDLKTVPLFELAIQAGGLESARFAEYEHTLMRFAREFGLAFQLTDDWLDGDLPDASVAIQQVDSALTVARALGERGGELLALTTLLHDRIYKTHRRSW